MKKKKFNDCPKAHRCKHADDCINHDTFRGEYLCFESKTWNVYELAREAQKKKGSKQ